MRHDKEMTRRHVVEGFYTLMAEFEIDETHEAQVQFQLLGPSSP